MPLPPCASLSPMARKRLFLSYAHADGRELARRLAADLRESGFDVWLDKERLLEGSSWSRDIEENIDRADAVVALLSRASYRSDGNSSGPYACWFWRGRRLGAGWRRRWQWTAVSK